MTCVLRRHGGNDILCPRWITMAVHKQQLMCITYELIGSELLLCKIATTQYCAPVNEKELFVIMTIALQRAYWFTKEELVSIFP